MGFICSLDKLEEFSIKAEMLGVELNLESFREGKIQVNRKESRVSEVIECVDRSLKNGFVCSDEALHWGKMQYAEAQLWGTGIELSDFREATLHKDSKVPWTLD